MYQITFVNHAWAQVRLEISTGNFQSCDQNASQGLVTLLLNDGHPIQTDASVVCWRRTANPDDPHSAWGNWNSMSPDDQNTPATIELN